MSENITGGELLALPGHDTQTETTCTILDWLENNARLAGDKPAILDVHNSGMTHTALLKRVSANVKALQNSGIGRGDVVLIMMPNGPEMLTAILSVAATAVAFPMPLDEPELNIEQLTQKVRMRGIVFKEELSSRATKISEKYDLVPLPVSSTPTAGEVVFPELSSVMPCVRTQANDAAILTRTAGTTAEPRLVAWSQSSLYISSAVMADWMGITSNDRSLCVMPFSHMHSLIRSTVPGLLRGGSVTCTAGFDPRRIFDWIAGCQPTYITASPGIYRTMLAHAPEARQTLAKTSLRLMVTGSDQIDASTVKSMAETFNVEVREFYGMTEVAPMLAATPTGHRPRSNSAIGVPFDRWKIECRDESGQILPPGIEGEIVARGGIINPVVGHGPGTQCSTDPAYHTGDLGFIDLEGWLHVTGRVDERITRGAEKIVPQAVEKMLEIHPMVERALVFPVPDTIVGERVCALVVPKDNDAQPCETELRGFLVERLPAYMVPERFVLISSLPVNSIGKINRKSLASTFQLEDKPNRKLPATTRLPKTATELELLSIVSGILKRPEINIEDDFMLAGGDSFLATSLLISIDERFGVMLTPVELLRNSRLDVLAQLIDKRRAGTKTGHEAFPIITVQQGYGQQAPLFFTHQPIGFCYYAGAFATALGPAQTVYAFRYDAALDTMAPTMEFHAARFVRAMRTLQPSGPYFLGGHSFGAHLAFEVAQQLVNAGEEVAFLAIMDDAADLYKRRFGAATEPEAGQYAVPRCERMLAGYVPVPYAGDIDLFIARNNAPSEVLADPKLGWQDLVTGEVECFFIDSDHANMMSENVISSWADVFAARLERARRRSTEGCIDWTGRRALVKALWCQPDMQASIAARKAGRMGDLDTEIREYRRSIMANPNQPYWVYRNLGDALSQQGSFNDAITNWQEGIRRESIPVMGQTLLAIELHRNGYTSRAMTELESAEQAAHDSAPAFTRIAEAWRMVGKPARAHKSIQQALALCSDDSSALLELGLTFAAQGKHEHAEKTLKKVIDAEARNATAFTELSKVFEYRGNPVEAVNAARQATELEPDQALHFDRLGRLLYKQREFQLAEASLRRALYLNTKLLNTYLQLARTLRQLGRIDDAIMVVRRAIGIRPTFPKAYVSLGTLLWAQGSRNAAEENLRHAIALDPGLGHAHFHLSKLLGHTGRMDEAIAEGRQAVALSPKNPDYFLGLATLLSEQGKDSEAERLRLCALDMQTGTAKA